MISLITLGKILSVQCCIVFRAVNNFCRWTTIADLNFLIPEKISTKTVAGHTCYVQIICTRGV